MADRPGASLVGEAAADRPDPANRDLPWSERAELVAGIAVALVSVALVGWMGRNQWFLSDSWDFLTDRDLTSLDDMLRPHAGHWQTPTAITHRVLYEVFGLDYWPAWDLPKLLGHAFLAFVTWRAMLWRGADRIFAFAVFGILLFSGVSDWHRIATIGNFIVFPVLLAIAYLLLRYRKPGDRQRAVLGGLLILALMSSGQGVAVLGGTILAVLVARRWREWGVPVLFAGLVYGLWYLSFRDDRASPDLSLDVLLDVPRLALEVLIHGVANSLGVSFTVGALVVIAGAVWAGWLAWRRQFTIYEGVLLGTLLVYLVLVVVTRVGPGTAQAEATRYSYAITFLLVPALVPHIRFPRASIAALAAASLIAVVGIANVAQLDDGLNFWEGRGTQSRRVVETAGALIEAGEPFVGSAAVDQRAGPLIMEGLEVLIADGWEPTASDDPAVVATARGALRFNVRPSGRVRGEAPVVAGDVDADGCAAVASGPLEMTLGDRFASLQLEADGGTAVLLVWSDDYGVGERVVTFPGRLGPDQTRWATMAEPEGATTVSVTVTQGDSVRVCGLTS